jgi:cytoskeletal protein RodZ
MKSRRPNSRAVLTFELKMFIFVLASVAVIVAMLGPQYYNLLPEESDLSPFEDAVDNSTFTPTSRSTSTSTFTSTTSSKPSSANYNSTETDMGANPEAPKQNSTRIPVELNKLCSDLVETCFKVCGCTVGQDLYCS